MDEKQRRERIVQYLGIKPINHGQVYTFQIAIPESEVVAIPFERHEQLKSSFTEQGTNLIPLLVRRTEAYSEEEEYEVVYGADWCLVAKELDIDKLWVWVFDMTDEQAAAAKEEMQQLVGYSNSDEKSRDEETDIASLVEQKVRPIYAKLNQLISNSSSHAGKIDFDDKLREIENKLENLSSAVATLTSLLQEAIPSKLNLLIAQEKEIKSMLEEVGANDKQKEAALEAIKYWRNPGKDLTWENLMKSIKSGEHKVKNFGKETYQKLKQIAVIRSHS
ncbi:hypothetical protein [Brasilonema sp. UFV-L1]|uniref:hypothetical protein n=1 Tax=Brasilonema sp. UFV-L1 TaxID=2234130 RepID=UPI00145E739D|nr:hypothetical protein [Brasilonema sp. UFV-L1]NMG09049.1 hypothetical protein [Brasilonema sp. UFV-L1]